MRKRAAAHTRNMRKRVMMLEAASTWRFSRRSLSPSLAQKSEEHSELTKGNSQKRERERERDDGSSPILLDS